MATLLLSAAGAAVGGLYSGTILGMSGAVIGRAVGATIGRVIDQRLLGPGSEPVEQGRVDRFRLTGAAEGAPIAQLFGRMRLGGQVIWATNFVEHVEVSGGGGGGKGAPRQPRTTTYSYSISLALALCEGEILRVGRVWADGAELDLSTITMRVYPGSETQMPDPLIEAVEGAGQVPAYRGTAYVVIENLDLSPFGNRVPQFAFEVTRPAQPAREFTPPAHEMIRAVALMPGTGEYALSTRPITTSTGFGQTGVVNVSAEGGGTDFTQSLRQMRDTLPNLKSVSLIYSWFGDDLRAGACRVRPKVEQTAIDGQEMPWRAGGIGRGAAEPIAEIDGRPVYGGTPADGSVIEAIQAIRAGGQQVLFYPFLLMEIMEGNGLPDPYGGPEQAALPWRGRITGDLAPDQPGTPDRTAANAAAVDAFFGSVTRYDFAVSNGTVTYFGPDEWSYSRFILHAAALCKAAGGVEAFCIGSEMRGLTQMRDATGFPAVGRLRALAAEVRALLPGVKLTYAADWSEYFGYHPQDGSGDMYFHLDPLWADDAIDLIAIDNYMPLSDWRDGPDHADAHWGVIHNLGYLEAGIEGGEGYDWFYPTAEARAAQRREPISPDNPEDAWIFRYKDLRGWWENPHEDRIAGLAVGLFPGFADPAGFAPIGGITITPDAGLFGHLSRPARIASGGGKWHRARVGEVEARAGDVFRLTAFVELGTSGEVRMQLRRLAGSTSEEAQYRGDPRVMMTPQFSNQQALEILGAEHVELHPGQWRISMTVQVTQDGTARFEIGPDSDVPGEDIKVFALQVTSPGKGGTAWVPQSKPIWFTEIGCAAIDNGTNQPNKFLDPKSSESALPHHSDGRRDDLIQAQYLRAVMGYWDRAENNPVSPVYGGPMLEMDRAHVWAWDARPWPAFPAEREKWTDGANWDRGHWITGRIEAAPLDQVVAELCEAAGLTDYDVSRLYGLVRGHVSGETETARARLQSLMLAFGFQAVERDGMLTFLPLAETPEAVVRADLTALDSDDTGRVTEIRAAEVETTGRLRLSYTAGESDYRDRVAEAVFPGDPDPRVSASELPMALTAPEAKAIAERWLAEARVAQDSLRFALPPSRRDVAAGTLVALEDGSTWRVDRVEDRGLREVEATRVEPSTRTPSDAVEARVPGTGFVPPVPVSPVFMDLPLLSGAEVPHAPHLAVTAAPWPGSVAVYSSASEDGFTLNRMVERGAIAGTLETPLFAALPGLWDRSGPLRVRLTGGDISAADPLAVLNGANLAAIGTGDDGEWEVIQFAGATLVGAGTWEIGARLRGQQGSDGVMPALWPEGSLFVLLDGGPVQVNLPEAARGLLRHWRIGPGRRPLDDPSYVARQAAFAGVVLRPYRPAHLRMRAEGGDHALSWVRRTRVDGDSWEGLEVPLGEAAEAYLIRVTDTAGLRREDTVTTPGFAYTAAMRAADGTAPAYSFEVAQLSDRFGAGPFARIEIDD